MANKQATAAPQQDTTAMVSSLIELTSHPQYPLYAQMVHGGRGNPDQPFDNQTAAGLEECVALASRAMSAAEKHGVPTNMGLAERAHPMLPV